MSADQHADERSPVSQLVVRVRELEADRDEARAWANTMEHERDWETQVVHSDLIDQRDRAEAQVVRLREALAAIRTRQPETQEMYRRHGIVFDYAPLSDPKAAEGETDWQNVAFRTYAVLCEIESMCAAALAGAEGAGE